LEEAVHTINTALERPPVEGVNPQVDTVRFMCLDIDSYTDKPPAYYSHMIGT
jgi:hypothetical protein